MHLLHFYTKKRLWTATLMPIIYLFVCSCSKERENENLIPPQNQCQLKSYQIIEKGGEFASNKQYTAEFTSDNKLSKGKLTYEYSNYAGTTKVQSTDETVYKYDMQNFLIQSDRIYINDYISAGSPNRTTTKTNSTYEYLNDRLISKKVQTISSAVINPINWVENFQYDVNKKLSKWLIEYSNGEKREYNFKNDTLVKYAETTNGRTFEPYLLEKGRIKQVLSSPSTIYTYDPKGRLIRIETSIGFTQKQITDIKYDDDLKSLLEVISSYKGTPNFDPLSMWGTRGVVMKSWNTYNDNKQPITLLESTSSSNSRGYILKRKIVSTSYTSIPNSTAETDYIFTYHNCL